jgi:hypothetical protein
VSSEFDLGHCEQNWAGGARPVHGVSSLGMTPTLNLLGESFKRTDGSMICLVDTLQYRILLKGLRLGLCGDRNRKYDSH